MYWQKVYKSFYFNSFITKFLPFFLCSTHISPVSLCDFLLCVQPQIFERCYASHGHAVNSFSLKVKRPFVVLVSSAYITIIESQGIYHIIHEIMFCKLFYTGLSNFWIMLSCTHNDFNIYKCENNHIFIQKWNITVISLTCIFLWCSLGHCFRYWTIINNKWQIPLPQRR